MADGRKNNKGQTGSKNGGGRKPKAEEQKLIEHLTPMHGDAIEALSKGLKNEDSWAIKLYFEYFYGKPQQRMDITTGGEPMNTPVISYFGTK